MDTKQKHLSLSQVTAAIRALSPFDLKRLRLVALRFAWTGWDPDDLLQEALMRMLDGRRNCPAGLDMAVALSGVVKSIASERTDAAKHVPILELVPSHGDEEAPKPMITPEQLRDDLTPERILAGRQELDAIRELFKADPPAEAVFDGMMAGYEGAELSEVSDIAQTELATVRKRIARRIDAALLKGIAK